MAKFRFHKLAALVVLVGFAAWMGTGSSRRSAALQNEAAAEAGRDASRPSLPLRTVAVVTPPRVNHARAIRISGQTEADKRATLATRVNGVIDELPVKQGQHVKRGDLIMTLDAEDKDAAVRMADSVVTQRAGRGRRGRAAGQGRQRAQAAGRQRPLRAGHGQVAAGSAKAELARNEIKAPFNGIVDRVPVERGSAIMEGGEVATLINLDPVLAIGEVSERDLRYLKIGDEADIRLVSGQTVKGTVRYISRDASAPRAPSASRWRSPIEDKALPAGMTAEITLAARADRRRHAAALGGDAQRRRATSASAPSTRTTRWCSSRSTWSTTRRAAWFSAASRPTRASSSPARTW